MYFLYLYTHFSWNDAKNISLWVRIIWVNELGNDLLGRVCSMCQKSNADWLIQSQCKNSRTRRGYISLNLRRVLFTSILNTFDFLSKGKDEFNANLENKYLFCRIDTIVWKMMHNASGLTHNSPSTFTYSDYENHICCSKLYFRT